MTTDEQLSLYRDVAHNYAFWMREAAKAWEEMYALAFDLSTLHTDQFRLAQERFELARSRCAREMKRIED